MPLESFDGSARSGTRQIGIHQYEA